MAQVSRAIPIPSPSTSYSQSYSLSSAMGGLSVSPQQQQQPSNSLHAIVETDIDNDDDDGVGSTAEEAESDYAERRDIGGDMLREMSIKSGYLLKKGERRKNWKKRYFVLRPDRLCYYKDDKEYQILRNISVGDVHACAQVEVKKHDNSFGIVTARRTYYVKADSRQEADEWVSRINSARKERDVRLQAQKEEQQSKDTTPVATAVSTPYNVSHADLLSVSTSGAQAGGSLPIPIRSSASTGTTFSHPQAVISPASDSGGFLSTSASSSQGDAGANYLSSSWASSSSEQSKPPLGFSRASTVRGGALAGSSSGANGGTTGWPDILSSPGGGGNLLASDGGLVDDPRSLHSPDIQLHSVEGSSRQAGLNASTNRDQSQPLSSSEEEEVLVSPSTGNPPPPPMNVQMSPGSMSAATAANPHRVVLAGYLMKQGKRKSWRKRWFTLYGNKLVYTRSHMDRKVHREIRLDSILDAMECAPKAKTRHFPMVPLSPGGNGNHSSLHSSNTPNSPPNLLPAGSGGTSGLSGNAGEVVETSSNCFKIITPSRSFVVCAPSEEEEIKWLSAIRVLIDASRAGASAAAAAAASTTAT